MQMQPVKSSNVESVGYDPASQTLQVKYRSGAEYQWNHVPPEEHKALISADSIGSHLHRHIGAHKEKYPVRKVEKPQA